MIRVQCEVSPGILPSEKTIEIRSANGRPVFLRTQEKNIKIVAGKNRLGVGLIYRDRDLSRSLIELPHEADGGENQIWVNDDQLDFGTPTHQNEVAVT